MRHLIIASTTAALVCASMLTALGWAYSSAAQALVSVVAAMVAAAVCGPAIEGVEALRARLRPSQAWISSVWALVAAWVALAVLESAPALAGWLT